MSHRPCFALLGLLAGAAMCQTSGGKPAFDIADVHVSPRTEWVKSLQHPLQGGYLAGDRYELHRATMLDLVRIAYNVDATKVYGGPSWLDYDRFEIIAKTKPGTRVDTLRLMLQGLLEDRFHLQVKADTRPAPTWLLTKGKNDLKLRAAADSAVSGGCQPSPRVERDGPTVIDTMQCRNMTMDDFAQFIRPRLSSADHNVPVVNLTGLEGGWDLDLRTAKTPGGNGPNDSFAEVLGRIGLKAELGSAPQPVLIVEHVDEQPSANQPGVAESLPPLRPEFEVASLKVCNGDGKVSTTPRFEAGGRVTATCEFVMLLVRDAWNIHLPIDENVPGTPKSLMGGPKSRINIVAKAPAGVAPDPAHNADARDVLNSMLRTLLIDRYRMKVHYEERIVDAPTLVAVKPKLTKADPAGRTGCLWEPPLRADGRVNLLSGAIGKLVCTNITMSQFAEQIGAYESQLAYPVLDATGIDGAWDFTIGYDGLASLTERFPLFAGHGADGQAAEPSGGLTLADALSKQLGLKLETKKRPERVFVIDHMEETPTEN